MNPALWRKALSDAWLQLVISSVLLLLFSWLFVWLMSLFKIGAWSVLLNLLPDFFKPMLGVPIAKLATPIGQLSILYVHVITMLVCVGWAVGRGSDPITGEIGRGTMDLILSLPIRRASLLVPSAVVSAAGAAVLAGCVWLGTAVGLLLVDLGPGVALAQLLPGAVNLCAMTFCITGITTLISSLGSDRWRTILFTIGFFIVSLIIEMVERLWPAGAWLKYFTILAAFQPQQLILLPDEASLTALKYNATLLGVGLLCYVAAAITLCRRDIPAAR